jgi:hypothetical protein
MVDYLQVTPDTELWRYTSFAKFASMLSTKAVHFARCDTFDDVFEGALGRETDHDAVVGSMDISAEKLVKHLSSKILQDPQTIERNQNQDQDFERDFIITTPISEWLATSFLSRVEEDGREATINHYKKRFQEGFREDMRTQLRIQFDSTFVSCWHAAPHESEAMWLLYAKDTKEGIAIKTTAGRLAQSLPELPLFSFCGVQYRDDFRYCEARPLERFFTKRRAFGHEKEVRVILADASARGKLGMDVPVALNAAIMEIRISPYAKSWFCPLVIDLCEKFGIEAIVRMSDLAAKPLFT